MDGLLKEVLSPVVVNPGNCRNCHDCIYSCPVKALRKDCGVTVVDRELCMAYVLKEEECLECITACKTMTLALRVFLTDGRGVVRQK